MPVDFTPVFPRYEALAAEADALYARVAAACPGLMPCGPGCGDCCHALFDLTFIEAVYLNYHFNKAFPPGPARDALLEQANRADREHYRLKRKAFRAGESGVSTAEILEDMAKERIRCPLLDDDNRCVLYAARPVTCRLYGTPLLIGGVTHTCGQTGFEPGGKYPTVMIEKLQDKLMALSQEVVAALPTKLPLMGDILVPVSLALITEYDDAFLGIPTEDDLVQLPEPPVAPAPAPTPSCAACGQTAGSAACDSCGGSTTWVLPGPDGAAPAEEDADAPKS
ncbi:MAG: YkgJ family cysteine cluster protein [Desulfovibrionaceae bacterium]